jgi:hypothetical protein
MSLSLTFDNDNLAGIFGILALVSGGIGAYQVVVRRRSGH